VSRRRRKMYCGHARLCVCVSVCLSAAVRPHYCTDPDVTWDVVEVAPSCILLGGFAIGARIALLWQHNANPSYNLASIPRYDDIVRTAGWAGSARAACRRPAGDGGVLNINAAVWTAGFHFSGLCTAVGPVCVCLCVRVRVDSNFRTKWPLA